MKIVNAQIIPITQLNGEETLKHIEGIARTCYKSENQITEDGESAKRLVRSLVKSNHGAMLEHASISMRYVSNVAAYKDLTRHRPGVSFAIESTRFNSYDKGKFGGEVRFLEPAEIPKDSPKYQVWLNGCKQAEQNYLEMAKLGGKPDELSLLLPHSAAAEFCITANLRSWRHILALRALGATGKTRPCVQEIMIPTLELFHEKIPVVFDDLYEKLQEIKQKQNAKQR